MSFASDSLEIPAFICCLRLSAAVDHAGAECRAAVFERHAATGVPASGGSTLTIDVNVTGCPTTERLPDEDNAIVVLALLTIRIVLGPVKLI